MQVRFIRRADNGTVADFLRPDGVKVRLHSYDRTGRIPHDAAHLVVERAFGLRHGVWGCLSAGALFATVEIVDGRRRHDSRARSAGLLQEHGEELRLAERVVGTVLAAVDAQIRDLQRDLAATWSLCSVSPPPDPGQACRTSLADLDDLQKQWSGLGTGDTVDLTWPVPRPARRRPAR